MKRYLRASATRPYKDLTLKRSFDNEDVDDMPSFSSNSPVSTPISPSSCHFFLNHNKTSEEQGGGGQSPFAFNNMGSAGHSRIRLSSSPSPVLKTRAIGSSLSFNRGTTNKPIIHNNSSSVTRAASFQSRLNPNICSPLTGPGSDNDSLHSSTSSLEYSGGGGYTLPINKLASYHSPAHQREYQGSQPQQSQQHLEANTKKFFSHGSVLKPEMKQGQGMMLEMRGSQGMDPSSVSILDFQTPNEGVGAGTGIQRGAGGGRISPGMKYVDANANWNGLRNASSFRESGSKKVCQQQGPQVLKSPQPKTKETPRLNKFPLDLDSLVSSISTTPPTKAEAVPLRPNAPKVPTRGSGDIQHHIGPPSTAASPSASLSSLDSSSDTPSHSFNYPPSPFSLSTPVPSQSSISVPDMNSSPVPFSPGESLQLDILSESQVVLVSPKLCSPSSSSSTPSPKAAGSLEDGGCDARDGVDLILQRIASFSWSDTNPAHVVQTPKSIQRSGGLPSALERPTETMPMTTWKDGRKGRRETAGELQTEPFTSMEERGEKERSIMREEDEGKNKEHLNIHTSPADKENCVEVHTELQENGKENGMEVGDLEEEKEPKAEVKVELCPPVPGLQTSFIRGSDLFGYVGIEAVLDQMRQKTIKAGFEFNIMVVGQSGLGKSTLVNTLFKSKVSRKSCTPNYEEKISKTVKLHAVSHVIEEKGVKLKLTVIDTPGFGDQINNENCWEPIVKYVNEQYEKYLREELNVNRKRRIPDSRVHCCIYFLPATGHRLRPIDMEFMKRLGKIVSIVPVIAKADTLTVEERQEFKERIRLDLAANGIQVYPQKELDEDPEERILNDRIRESIPFAVVGTDKEHQVNGNKVLGRKTKWGIIEVENVAHCEFANLRDLLIRSHLQDLKDVTHNIHYETYRVRRLNESNMNFSDLVLSTWPLENGTDKCEAESHL
ncbi:uncharacterized protein sept12 isoform X2 [Melanotaenia boesemani]|uniref:uncharacterized protein sept12 isoform X2 n=1 Tax=Melanotaenia boesemani TaxID=1250792 RepID=UPI001C045573|nr:uncharacterized protein sept12 isoform X2 [Melanotaenia boesemani]